jgi:hypothetical protein
MTYTGPAKTTTWITPQWIIDLIGMSDLDQCGYKTPDGAYVTRCASGAFTLRDREDGLQLPWEGSVYCNPPYDQNAQWLHRCRKYHEQTGEDVIVLLFNRSETQYFQLEVASATGLVLVSGRINFLDETGRLHGNSPGPSVLIAYGESAFERIQRVPGIPTRILHRKKCQEPSTMS